VEKKKNIIGFSLKDLAKLNWQLSIKFRLENCNRSRRWTQNKNRSTIHHQLDIANNHLHLKKQIEM
jgi:hypothetical protein